MNSDPDGKDERKDAAPPRSDAPGNDAPLDEAEMLRRAEAAVAALKEQYPLWAEGHIADLATSAEKARADPAGRAAHFAAIADVAHDVKGEGATYDYPLMTELGHLLHAHAATLAARLEADPGACDADALDAVDQLVAAMRRVIGERLENDGGAEGRALMAPIRDRFGGP